MKVLMYGPHPNLNGGVATVARNYLSSELNEEFNIKYISTVEGESKISKYFSATKAYINTFFYMNNDKVKIVHIHLASRGSYERKKHIINYAKRKNKKIVIQLHGAEFMQFYNDESSIDKQAEIRKILNKADLIIALGENWRRFLLKITDTKIVVIHNSVFCNNTNKYKKDSKNIIFMGRLEERKGIYDLLKVIKNINNKNFDYKFLLCGDGEIDKVNSKVLDYGIKDKVKVLGWVNDEEKEKIYLNSVLNILPSYNEGLPMSILEAMSYGIPTISTYVGGIPDLIDNSVDGILIQPGDIYNLEKSIMYIIQNEKKRVDISQKSFEKIYKNFNLQKNIREIKKIYINLTEGIK